MTSRVFLFNNFSGANPAHDGIDVASSKRRRKAHQVKRGKNKAGKATYLLVLVGAV
jgi:hypothetical protein